MKIVKYIIIASLVFLFANCSDDEQFMTVKPRGIEFVYQDGSAIGSTDCIDPSMNYAIEITVNFTGSGSNKDTRVDYTINGVNHSMTFTQSGSKLNPVYLIEGENVAQIVETSYTSHVYFVKQDDFEEVN